MTIMIDDDEYVEDDDVGSVNINLRSCKGAKVLQNGC